MHKRPALVDRQSSSASIGRREPTLAKGACTPSKSSWVAAGNSYSSTQVRGVARTTRSTQSISRVMCCKQTAICSKACPQDGSDAARWFGTVIAPGVNSTTKGWRPIKVWCDPPNWPSRVLWENEPAPRKPVCTKSSSGRRHLYCVLHTTPRMLF